MIRRWLALTYYLYALRLAALSHFYFNRLYNRADSGSLKRLFCYIGPTSPFFAYGKGQVGIFRLPENVRAANAS